MENALRAVEAKAKRVDALQIWLQQKKKNFKQNLFLAH